MRKWTLFSVVVIGAVVLVGSFAGWAGAAEGPAASMGGYLGDNTGYGSMAAGVSDSCGKTPPASSMGGYLGDNTGYGSMAAGVSGSGCPGGVATSADQAATAPEFAVENLGEANAVASVLPEGKDTLIRLRDGTDLVVPSTINVPDTVYQGSWINARVQQIDGKNIVTSLSVVSDAGSRTGGNGGSGS